MKILKAVLLVLVLSLAGAVYASDDSSSKKTQTSCSAEMTGGDHGCCKEGSTCKADSSCCVEGSTCCAMDCCKAGASCCTSDGKGCKVDSECCSDHACCSGDKATKAKHHKK